MNVINNDLNIYIVYNNVHFEPFVGINSYMNTVIKTLSLGYVLSYKTEFYIEPSA